MTRTDDLVMERLRAADPLHLDDLDRLLRDTAAPDLPASRARPPRRGRRVLWGAATAAAVVGVAGVLVLSLPRGEERAAIPGHIGILDRPATESDRLPAWVYGERAVLELEIDRDAARLAATTGRRRYYVVPARGGAVVCLVDVPLVAPPLPRAGSGVVSGPGGNGGIQCAPQETFEKRFLVAAIVLRWDGAASEVAGIVPDGFDRASMGDVSVAIHDNVFVLRTPRLQSGVRASGPAGDRTAFHGYSRLPVPSRGLPDLDLTVSVFSRPATTGDLPPDALRVLLDAARSRAGGPDPAPGTERHVATVGKTSYWLVRDRFARRGPRALLAMVTRGGVVLRPLALPTRDVPFQAWPTTQSSEPYGPTRVTLRTMVPDGFTTATIGNRTFPVRDNFLLVRKLPVTDRYTVELRGPAGTLTAGASPLRTVNRYAIPTNDVPYRVEELVASRARRAGLAGPLSATIVAGLRENVPGVLGTWARLAGSGGGPRPEPSPFGLRTVPVIAVRSGDQALLLVVESAVGPDPAFKERRYRADQVPDLSVLGRVRPLKLD